MVGRTFLKVLEEPPVLTPTPTVITTMATVTPTSVPVMAEGGGDSVDDRLAVKENALLLTAASANQNQFINRTSAFPKRFKNDIEVKSTPLHDRAQNISAVMRHGPPLPLRPSLRAFSSGSHPPPSRKTGQIPWRS